MAEVVTEPVVEETPVKEQAPMEEPTKKEKKENHSKVNGAKKKSLFASMFSCFGSKSQVVVLETHAVKEEAKEGPNNENVEKPTESMPVADKPVETVAEK